MTHWWVAEQWEQGPVFLVSWVVWVIGSIVLHELAHGIVAIWCGDDTPRRSGHMTLNPLVHMGQMSLILFALIGIAWGQMPVDPSRFRRRYDDALVSLAGPLMNLLLFVVSLAGAAAVAVFRDSLGTPLGPNLAIFCITGVSEPAALMLFNLLPVPPLDGARILASVFPPFGRLWNSEHGQAVAMVAFVLVFFFAGEVVFGAAMELTSGALDIVLRLVGRDLSTQY